jgi:hypothetical protein
VLCESELCQAIAQYDPPKDVEEPKHFISYLQSKASHDERYLDIGTPQDILRNRHCPVCRFVWSKIKDDDLILNDEVARCQVEARGGSLFFLIRFILRDGIITDRSSNWGEQVLLVKDGALMDNRESPLGRLIDRDVGVSGKAKEWLQHCERLHRETCPLSERSDARTVGHKLLRVVDLAENRLVEIEWKARYVALSYVWGTVTPPRLFKADIERLSTPGGLEKLRAEMPQTIRDAMTLSENLRLQYFWFDSLCLVQDDPAELHQAIRRMDTVYEGAYLTIIFAQGDNAEVPLPGVSVIPRILHQEYAQIRPGFGLLRARTLDGNLNDSVYASRGWT